MQLANIPSKILKAFGFAGGKNTIPFDSQIGVTPGAASYEDGFPPLTRTPLVSGGVPPSGLDMNGVLYEATNLVNWLNAGGGFPYDGTFATDPDVNGYPKGARVMRADGTGYWLSIVDNNTTDPDAGGSGWVPDYVYGVESITMTSSNVTLTAPQYGKPIIKITGTLTTNLNLNFPNSISGEWVVINSTSGAFTITAKTISGTGVTVTQGGATAIVGDGTDIQSSSNTTDATTSTKGIVQLADSSEAIAGTNATKAITPITLRDGLNATGSAPIYACRAWVRTSNATGTIAASGNVSSVANPSAGRFTVNFTVALPDANYAYEVTGKDSASTGTVGYTTMQHDSIAPTSSACDFLFKGASSGTGAGLIFSAAFFR